jgi:hypothetical protein
VTRWVTERLDVLADRWVAVVTAGFLWIAAEFIAALGVILTYR